MSNDKYSLLRKYDSECPQAVIKYTKLQRVADKCHLTHLSLYKVAAIS